MSPRIGLFSLGSTSFRLLLIVAVFTLLAFPLPITASDVTVGCGGTSGSYNYTSIRDALDALHADTLHPHTIKVFGTCKEGFGIREFLDLSIEAGQADATIEDIGERPYMIFVENARVTFRGLRLRGIAPGVHHLVMVRDSRATFVACTLENAGKNAIETQRASQVLLTGATVQDNGTGVYLREGSALIAEDGSSPTVIQQNGVGIWVLDNSVARLTGGTLVQDNTGAGIQVQSSHLVLTGRGSVSGNGAGGISLNGGTLDASGSLIQGNHGTGIMLTGASATLNDVTVEGNGGTYNTASVGGVGLMSTSALNVTNSHVIRNNNRGVSAHFNSSVSLFNTEVSGNGTDGVRVEQLSSALVASMSQVTKNAGNDLFCSPDSVAFGPRDLIGKLYCPGFNQTPLPHWNEPPPEP